MKYISKILAGVALLLSLNATMTSCGTSYTMSDTEISRQINQIKRGMTMNQVREVLGAPADKLLVDGRETWRYRRTNMLTSVTKIIEVGFINDRVEYINTHDDK